MGEDATILEKPSKDYAIMLTDSELLGKMIYLCLRNLTR